MPISFRFWLHVKKDEGCWNWIGATKNKSGYGGFNVGGKSLYAHRFAYELTFGPIPDGMFVCHKCDNPKCVNPCHLFIGTNKDNCLDRKHKGRNCNQNKFKTHCKYGHEFTVDNTYVYKSKSGASSRYCKACWKIKAKTKKLSTPSEITRIGWKT